MKNLYNDPSEIRSEFSKWSVGCKWASYGRFCKWLTVRRLWFWRLFGTPKTAIFALNEAWFRRKSALVSMQKCLIPDASKPYFLAGRCSLPPWQQADDHKRAYFRPSVRLKAPVGRVLFSMKNLYKSIGVFTLSVCSSCTWWCPCWHSLFKL